MGKMVKHTRKTVSGLTFHITFTSTRNIKGETDTVTLTTGQTIFGMGFGF